MYVYPQLFHLERPSFTLAVRYMPNTDLCGGGNVGTGQAPPCTECPDKIPFVPQDVFDLQWAEPVTSVVVRLPNGGTVPSAGIVSVNGVRIRISFCNAPPCFSVEINNQCTFLSFERVSCFVGCDEQPSPDDPNPIEPPPPTAQAAFVNIEHVRVSDWLRMSTNFVGVTDALCSFVRYPNTPVSYLASSRNGLGGAVAEHLHATTSGALVSVSITEGLAYFVGWAFDAPSMLVLGYTESGVYDPAPLPPVFVSGNATTPNITFIVPAGKYIHVFAMFDFNQTPPPMLYKAQSGPDTAEEFGVVEVRIGLISPNMGLFTLPENEVLVCNVEFQVGATSMNHVNLSASFWDSIDETTISTLIAYYKQFTTPINSGTNIRCTTKFVRIEEHIYVKSIITNIDNNTVLLERGFMYLAQQIMDTNYHFIIGTGVPIANILVTQPYVEPLPSAFAPTINSTVYIFTALNSTLGNQTVALGLRHIDSPVQSHYPPPNYCIAYEMTANVQSPTVSNTISMTLSNTGATVLNNVPLSVSGTLPIKIVVRHKLVPQAAIRTYDWFIQVQIFNNVTNSLIFDTGYVFVTTRNPYDGMQFPYFTETYTLNNTGNTARFFNFIVVNTYLEPI